MKKKLIGVIMQGFYGNRTFTEIADDDIDYILQGILDKKLISMDYEPDRTAVRIPDSKCVLVYNKYQEAARIEENKRNADNSGCTAKPLAFIPQENIEIFSRCFLCRMNDEGEFESLCPEDSKVVVKYLAQ